jgi:hypothetical protein
MNEKLEPCPFCGSEAGIPTNLDGTPVDYEITDCCCKNDDCPLADYWTPIKIWQTRPTEDALRKRIAELEEKQRWIPVSERLPEIEEGDSKEYDVVITYPRERSVIVAWWTYNIFDKTHQRRIWTEDQGEFGHEDITKYVTHWRERPTPPEVK